MNARDALKALDDLKASPGWEYLTQVMQDEIVQTAFAIAEDPVMTERELDFRRGAMFAAKKLLHLPDQLILRLSSDSILDNARKDDTR
ncbi:hypothetical protein GCM10023116_48250 [Kistimonas scapharcae]|uniref:Uncharacterized protein n=1 Tax=Kistimonas scapharcae TaxID=1036133 RepID=A0ABP8V9H1_9GAMM